MVEGKFLIYNQLYFCICMYMNLDPYCAGAYNIAT